MIPIRYLWMILIKAQNIMMVQKIKFFIWESAESGDMYVTELMDWSEQDHIFNSNTIELLVTLVIVALDSVLNCLSIKSN